MSRGHAPRLASCALQRVLCNAQLASLGNNKAQIVSHQVTGQITELCQYNDDAHHSNGVHCAAKLLYTPAREEERVLLSARRALHGATPCQC